MTDQEIREVGTYLIPIKGISNMLIRKPISRDSGWRLLRRTNGLFFAAAPSQGTIYEKDWNGWCRMPETGSSSIESPSPIHDNPFPRIFLFQLRGSREPRPADWLASTPSIHIRLEGSRMCWRDLQAGKWHCTAEIGSFSILQLDTNSTIKKK